jgi:hypothetical protein
VSTENLILLAPARIIYYRAEMIALMRLCLKLFTLQRTRFFDIN